MKFAKVTFNLGERNIAFINNYADSMNLPRSDVVRRMFDLLQRQQSGLNLFVPSSRGRIVH